MTVSVGLTPVPCTPDYIPTSVEYDSDAGTRYQPSSPASVAYMEIPSADSERGKDAFVGHMSSDKQISDKGIVTNPSTGVDATIGPSLKTDSLFSTYHSDLASWMAKDRQVVTAALNLKAAEIVNIKMYNRVYFASRYWIISKLTIELSAAGGVRTTGEFIEA